MAARLPTVVAIGGAALLACVTALLAQRPDAFVGSRDDPAIAYSTAPVHDPIATLNDRLQNGSTQLVHDEASGYLRSVLKALDVPTESQLAVFSHTSAQAAQISLTNPRAIFFNDSTMVGWVRGSDHLELAAQDPTQGTIFYRLTQSPYGKPLFRRDNTCLQCHLLWDTLGVPGPIVISTFPMSDDPNAYADGFAADHRSPLDRRWGGWYVTGKSVPDKHMGNVPVILPPAELARLSGVAPKLESLAGRVDPAGFPSSYSDVVALMVLEHQTRATNLLTRLGWEARRAAASPSGPAARGPAAGDRVGDAARDLADYFLFADEAPLPGAIRGSSGFAEHFSAQGPRDNKGRSLRQFDLNERLMRYPCSYMIYSKAFDALPTNARALVYREMWHILSGDDPAPTGTRLSLGDRRAIVEILRDTKTDLPAYFVPVIH